MRDGIYTHRRLPGLTRANSVNPVTDGPGLPPGVLRRRRHRARHRGPDRLPRHPVAGHVPARHRQGRPAHPHPSRGRRRQPPGDPRPRATSA
ncbi:hypothetical protein ACU686_32715 [Yinghuangia aomiensis]